MGLRQSMSCLDQEQQQWLVGSVLSVSFLWYITTRPPAGLPPSPGRGLPLVGHTYLLNKDPRAQFRLWRRQLGDVFSLYMGPRLVIVLNGLPAIQEALVQNGRIFSDRPHCAQRFRKSMGQGILNNSCKDWHQQRAVTSAILRQMNSVNNNAVSEKVQEEITRLVTALHLHRDGLAFDLRPLLQLSVTNALWSIIFGAPEEYDNAFFRYFAEALHNHFELVGESSLIHFLPACCTCAPEVTFLKRSSEVVETLKTLRTYVAEKVSFVLKQNPRASDSFVGGYMEKAAEFEKSQNDFYYNLDRVSLSEAGSTYSAMDWDNHLNELNLRRDVFDLFIAGAESTTVVLQWLILQFLYRPELQERCYREIARVTKGRTPSLDDRNEMTYVQATIMETLRFSDILPLAMPHGVRMKTFFRKYVVPKDSTIAVNLSSVLKDYEIWGDPERFRPERFITLEGKLEKPPEYIPFGTGRRRCVGSSLAQAQIFLYVCSLVQRFRFLPDPAVGVPTLQGTQALFNNPPSFKLRLVPRDTAIH